MTKPAKSTSTRISPICIERLSTIDLVVVAGKGGVGKTVLTAALGAAAARAGRDVTLVEIEGKAHLCALLGVTSGGYEPVVAMTPEQTGGGTVRVRTIGPDQALVEWLRHNGLGRVANQLAKSGALEVIATATPGIKDLLVLGRVKQMFNESDSLVIIDAPASGHAISFLQSPAGLAATARVGVINRQARQVLEMLEDHDRSAVVLVGLAEETPISELVETVEAVSELNMALGPLVINQIWSADPQLADHVDVVGPAGDAARFVTAVVERQREALATLEDEADMAHIILPHLDAEICRPEIAKLSSRLDDLFAS